MTHPTRLRIAPPLYDASDNSYFPAVVRVVRRGQALYSSSHYAPRCHLGDEPIVEVYDARYPRHSDLGQYVTSCYASDFLSLRGAWDLDGGVPEWTLDAETVARIQTLARPYLAEEATS